MTISNCLFLNSTEVLTNTSSESSDALPLWQGRTVELSDNKEDAIARIESFLLEDNRDSKKRQKIGDDSSCVPNMNITPIPDEVLEMISKQNIDFTKWRTCKGPQVMGCEVNNGLNKRHLIETENLIVENTGHISPLEVEIGTFLSEDKSLLISLKEQQHMESSSDNLFTLCQIKDLPNDVILKIYANLFKYYFQKFPYYPEGSKSNITNKKMLFLKQEVISCLIPERLKVELNNNEIMINVCVENHIDMDYFYENYSPCRDRYIEPKKGGTLQKSNAFTLGKILLTLVPNYCFNNKIKKLICKLTSLDPTQRPTISSTLDDISS